MRQQHMALGRDQLRAGGEIDIRLRANRVLRAVAVGVVGGVIEERIDGLIALQIHDADELPALDLMHKGVAGQHIG